ncbi:hypothetical protein H6G89_07985 [Oscillatoria sp. FACHB-1407]|uniref:hypothetical protein n=1 Tax=Oscillatoria sp. FACHB-1407 TaxID=2692847 RepID=UPI0016825D76|nr:hypothetical protein [Oscillatoria sp. FACHB-1407]MBD2460981.1 hypothetical protein [Oscillatoria sp. FACHB-1407]
MKREVVQDFLNLPGIAGIALMDGRSRPYFCGVDQALNFQQKEALAQGIQQVVETTPDGFEFFEFQFTEHQVYIYKLDHGIILLVLTSSNLMFQTYAKAIEQLKAELHEDASNAIATFRLLAGNITLSNQAYWKQRSDVSSSTLSGLSSNSSGTNTKVSVQTQNGSHSTPIAATPHPSSQNLTQYVASANPLTQPHVNHSAVDAHVNLKELLVALNHLSQFTTQYLGTTVITNYWKSTRPDIEWLNNFQIDRSAHFTFTNPPSANSTQTISSKEHEYLQQWISAFVARCSKVIRDFPIIIEQRALDDRQKNLLLKNNP